MKHGIHIPKELRTVMAKRAYEIFQHCGNKAKTLAAIEDEFDVSTPTARNLLGLGKSLAEEKTDDAA